MSFLDEFNSTLVQLERELPAPDDAAAPVFVAGVPRSGTTLVSQALAAFTDVGYVNNIMARFWSAPAVGARFSIDLNLPREFSGQSEGGRTAGLGEPHEFGAYWRAMLGYEDMTQKPGDGGVDWDTLIASLRRVAAVFERPVMYKIFQLYWHVRHFHSRWPQTRWIRVRRDRVDNAMSLLRFRESMTGSIDTWVSARPLGAELYDTEPPWVQVAAQVHLIEAWLDQEFAALPAGSWTEVHLDNVCLDLVGTVRSLAGFASLAVDDSLLVGRWESPRQESPANDQVMRRKVTAALQELETCASR